MATISRDGVEKQDGRYQIPSDVEQVVHDSPRGSYQRGLIDGDYPWSGAGLSGEARAWGSQYARSRSTLVTRINIGLCLLDWSASSALVTCLDGRTRRRLLLVSPRGTEYVWS